MSAIIFQIQSTVIILLMIFGISKRKNRKLHPKIMLLVIVWDIILILQIELNRSAIAKASKVTSNETLLNVHVSLAVLTVILYFVQLYTGRKIIKQSLPLTNSHRFIGWLTFSSRILTYLTSFFIATK